MALSTREVLMIIRAKDLASSELARIGTAFGQLDNDAQSAARSAIQQGSALMGLGVAMGAAGVAALAFYANSAKAAMEYNRESALTLTQVDQLGVSLKDVAEIGKRVARDVAAPFEEMQSSLYDIFSSMEVSVKEAEVLLNAHARAAVAGQTSIQVAGRATIAIMNAFKIPAEDVNRVLDVQFQTVRKGVITYEELATTIGRAIPSAVKAGASIEELGAAMAFATRMGLSAAMSATSVARAYDLLSNPKFGAAMEQFGIKTVDATGKFRPMLAVVTDLRNKFTELGYTEEQIAEKLKQLTTGAGGTIQAMRFLNLAVQDSGGLFKELSGDLDNAAGSFEEAYKIMSNTPAAKIQELKNAWQILRVEIGDRVLPAIGALAEMGKRIIDWFLDMDPKLLDQIVHWGKLIALWLTLTGILVTIHGAFLVLSGVLTLLGGSVLKVIAAMSGWGLIAAAIIYVATETELLQKAWEGISSWVTGTFWPAMETAFQAIKNAWDSFTEGFRNPGVITDSGNIWAAIGENIGGIFQRLSQGAIDFWHAFNNPESVGPNSSAMAEWGGKVRETLDTGILGAKAFWEAFNGDGITSDGFVGHMEAAGVKAREVTEAIKTAWNETLTSIANAVREEGFVGAITSAFADLGKNIWHWIQDNTPKAYHAIEDFFVGIGSWIIGTGVPMLVEKTIELGVALVKWIADAAPKAVEAAGTFVADLINAFGTKAPDLIEGGKKLFMNVFTGLMDQLPRIQEIGFELLTKLTAAIVDYGPLVIPALVLLLAIIVKWILTEMVPAVLSAWNEIGLAIGRTGLIIAGMGIKAFTEVGNEIAKYIIYELVPKLVKGFLEFIPKFTDEVAPGIMKAVINPFEFIFKKLVGRSIIPDTVNGGLAEWTRFKDQSGVTFEELKTNVTGKTEDMKGALIKLFTETGEDSHKNWREKLSQMPGSTSEISEETYQAITNVLSGLPGWTGGTGHETQAQWVVNLGKGTGGTRGTTGDWANAMASILNQLLQGVGAAPIELGNTAGAQSTTFAANGLILDFLARGGIRDSENHVAQVARAGEMRVWAEPETGGEAYIPLGQNKRSRSVRILKEVADRFGMTLAEYAQGGVTFPEVPDFGAFGNMVGTRGGKDSVTYTREAIIAWNAERERKLAEAAAQGVGGGSLGGGGWQAITNYLDSQGVPYQITSTTGGQHAPGSYHYAGKAVDMVSDNMMQIFNTLTQVGGSLAELFYDPAGWSIKNGQRVDWTVGGHSDHVHGAVMDAGGVLQQGLSMILNGTGKPEAVFNWDQFKALEWLMGHAEKVAEASTALPPSGATQQAAGAVSEHQRLMSMGGRDGYAPSLGMMVETAQHTSGILGSNASGLEKFIAYTAGAGSLGLGMKANSNIGIGVGGSIFGNPLGLTGMQTSQGPVFSEGAIQMQITGSNPEQIAAQVEAKIRSLIAEIRMR